MRIEEFINILLWRKKNLISKQFRPHMSWAMYYGIFDMGLKLAIFRHWTDGIAKTYAAVNVDFWRRPIPIAFAAALTCWTSVPFEIAKKAYYADQKFPAELRKNYKSITNALFRIPFEEGPAYLFRSALPTVVYNFVLTATLFGTYEFWLDFFNPLHVQMDHAQFPIKFASTAFSVFLGTVAAYPFNIPVRATAELVPYQLGGGSINYSYTQAMHRLMVVYRHTAKYAGYGNYIMRTGPGLFVTLWVAEWMGIFKNWQTDYFRYPGVNIPIDLLE